MPKPLMMLEEYTFKSLDIIKSSYEKAEKDEEKLFLAKSGVSLWRSLEAFYEEKMDMLVTTTRTETTKVTNSDETNGGSEGS